MNSCSVVGVKAPEATRDLKRARNSGTVSLLGRVGAGVYRVVGGGEAASGGLSFGVGLSVLLVR